jgi:hypothetical protein
VTGTVEPFRSGPEPDRNLMETSWHALQAVRARHDAEQSPVSKFIVEAVAEAFRRAWGCR